MAGRIWKPPVGSKVWFAKEHFYYVPNRAGPMYEFMIYEGEVRGYRTGNWTDINIAYKTDEGYLGLIDVVLSANRQKIFDNPHDAALLAKEMTDEYMKHWGWIWKMGYEKEPMRRRWEKYLTEGADKDAGGTEDH